MESAYKPEQWHDVFVMIGTSAGALVGLLFIVISLHIGRIGERRDDNMRAIVDGARYNTIHLLTVLVEAVVILAPQPATLVGAELIALNVFGMRGPVMFSVRYAGRQIRISHRGSFPTGLILTISMAYLLGIAGGVAVLRHADWSLYLVAASCVIKIVRAVLTAWMLMFGMIQSQSTEAGR
jgi:hypothetical protein